MVGWPYCDHGYGIGWNRKLPSKTRWASTELIDFLGWYAIFEPEPCLSPNQISASIVISISISASTFAYFYLHVSIYIYRSIYTSLCVQYLINILHLSQYLHLPTSSCFHLHLPTSIYIYLLYRSIYTSLCVQYLINIYICILMYNTSMNRWIHRSFYISKHIHTYLKQNKCTICNRTYGHIDVT
jgi:hypothetical protein